MARASKLTVEQWQTCRGEREAGATWQVLSDRYGVSRMAIQKKAKIEGWLDPSQNQEVIKQKVAVKVAKIKAHDSPEKREEALDAQAKAMADVIERHRKEWAEIAQMRIDALAIENDKDAVNAWRNYKTAVDGLEKQQSAERRAWGLDVYISPQDWDKMTDEQLEAIAQGKAW